MEVFDLSKMKMGQDIYGVIILKWYEWVSCKDFPTGNIVLFKLLLNLIKRKKMLKCLLATDYRPKPL